MGILGRFVDSYWTATATIVIVAVAGASSIIALFRDRPGLVIPVVGILVTLLVGLWTVEFLRRDLRLRTRPYLAIVENHTQPTSPTEVLVVPVLRVAGDYPAVVTGQTAVVHDGTSGNIVPGNFTRNIVYPGEAVNAGRYVVPRGGSLQLQLEYEDFGGRREYNFAIEYEVEGTGEVAIRNKTGN